MTVSIFPMPLKYVNVYIPKVVPITPPITIINPKDENPLACKNSRKNRNRNLLYQQFQHGNVNVSGDKFSVALVFRVCKYKNYYWKKDDTQVVKGQTEEGGDTVEGCLGYDFGDFHSSLKTLYHNRMF